MRGEGSRAEISEEGVCAACSAKLNTLRRQQAGARRGRCRGREARGARRSPSPPREFGQGVSAIWRGAGC